MILSIEDARLLLVVVTAITAFSVAWLKALSWPEWIKFVVAIAISGVGGALTAYINDALRADASLIQNLAVVYLAGRIFYFGAFQVLGLERVLMPRAALATIARQQVSEQLACVSKPEAQAVFKQSEPDKLDVRASVVKDSTQKDSSADTTIDNDNPSC